MGFAPSFIPFGRRAITAGGVLNMKHKLNGIRVINSTGSDIAADKLVAVVGYNTTNKLPKIVLADANDATHKDIYVTLAAIGNGDEGFVYKGGLSAATLDTSAVSTTGDPVYLSETAGAFTASKPGGSDVSVLPVGWAITDSSTVGQIHWHIGEIERMDDAAEVVAATNVITAAENNKVFFLNHATEFASTLPAPFLGAHYTFIVANAPESADYTIVTEGGCQVLGGHVLTSDVYTDSAVDADKETDITGTTITFVQAKAVVGDIAELWSDGTGWYARCSCSAVDGITITG
jgi:hypothetical protein